MLFSLEVLPAAEGDCFLLHWDQPGVMALVDAGPKGIYRRVVEKRFQAIRDALQVTTLTLELVMVSHVDNDHIVGITQLFADLVREHQAQTPLEQRPLKVERLWHNTFTDVLGAAYDSYYQQERPAIVAAAASGDNPEQLAASLRTLGLGELSRGEGFDLALVLAGHGEGRAIRGDYEVLHQAGEIQRLNTPFLKEGQPAPVQRAASNEPVPVAGLSIQVIGPSEAELVRLRRDFDAYLKEHKLSVPAALVAAAQDKDTSPTNLSSIVCLVGYGDKAILFTGDARGDRILQGLKEMGLLAVDGLHVNILKLPHHGSARNCPPEFFEAIHAEAYVISANGKYENPDRETLERLIDSRARDASYEIVFTYALKDIDAGRRLVREGDGKAWDDAKDGVGALLQTRKAAGYAFTWSEGGRVLNLGDDALQL